jgi:hypothetical protein
VENLLTIAFAHAHTVEKLPDAHAVLETIKQQADKQKINFWKRETLW